MKKHVIALKWFSRVVGSIIVVLTIISLIFQPLEISRHNITQLLNLCAYGTMIAGFIVGWKHEGISGILILSGYCVFAVLNGIIYLNWILALFPLIGLIYLYVWWCTGQKGNDFLVERNI